MRPSEDAISVIILRERMTATVAYDTVKSISLSVDDPSAHVLEYIYYWLLISVVFTLKDILGMSIFVSGGSKKRKHCALKVVDVAIFS